MVGYLHIMYRSVIREIRLSRTFYFRLSIILGIRTSFANEAIYDAVGKVLQKVQSFLADYRDAAKQTLQAVSNT